MKGTKTKKAEQEGCTKVKDKIVRAYPYKFAPTPDKEVDWQKEVQHKERRAGAFQVKEEDILSINSEQNFDGRIRVLPDIHPPREVRREIDYKNFHLGGVNFDNNRIFDDDGNMSTSQMKSSTLGDFIVPERKGNQRSAKRSMHLNPNNL